MEQTAMEGHFGYGRLIRFVLPCIFMMVVTSVYSIVDGYFVSNFAGKNAFAAVNLVMPVLMGCGAVGFMIGSGGSALVAFTFGTGKNEEARQIFTMLEAFLVVTSLCISAVLILFMPRIVDFLGASDLTRTDCINYGRLLAVALTFFMLQNSYQSFLITAGKSQMGLVISVISGVSNMILDFVFVYVMRLGIIGAGTATALCQTLGAIVPTFYFLRPNDSSLRFVPFRMNFRDLFKACSNGISEMLTNISMSVVSIVYNWQLLRIAAENGISAYGVVMYVSFIFLAVFFGFSMSINPLAGYHYGAANREELKSLLRKSLVIIGITAVVMTAAAEVLAGPISALYVGYDRELYEMTVLGFRLYSVSYLFMGFNVFASAFFTGLNNGFVSGVISFSRTFVVELIAVIVLPMIFGITGIWLAVSAAEAVTLFLAFGLLIRYRNVYGYL